MFESAHDPGCDDWYDDLEAWMRSRGERVTAETVVLAALKIGGATVWVPEDLRFLNEIGTQQAAMAREEVRKVS